MMKSMGKVSKYAITSVSLLAFLSCGVAVAAEIPRGETVRSRPKPELDPLGVRARDFLFFPKATISDSYDSNVMSSDTDEISDHIINIDLDGMFKSDWKLHSLNFGGNVKSAQYVEYSDENFNDVTLKADGRYDVSSEFNLTAGTNLLFGHEDRGSPDDANGLEPGQYTKFTLNGGADKSINRYSIKGGFTIDQYDYDDVKTTGADVNHDDRDRYESVFNIRGGYEFNPEKEIFARLEVNDRSYIDDVDDNGVDRDSQGFELKSGLSFDLTGITFGNVFAGYRQQSIDDASLAAISGPIAGFDLTWNVTTLTTIKGSHERTVEETTSPGASGIFRSKSTVSIDHELLRNMIVSSKFGYTYNDYEGIDRTDKEPSFEFAVDYKLNRNLYSEFKYNYSSRISNTEGSDYDKHVFKIQLTAQF
jgi:hypothetical protein